MPGMRRVWMTPPALSGEAGQSEELTQPISEESGMVSPNGRTWPETVVVSVEWWPSSREAEQED